MIRFFDILFSFFGLIILTPVLLIISCFIFFEDFHSVFYFQRRIGKNGEFFNLIKFRTMRPDSDKMGMLTIGKDPRITKTGFFLRKYKLDEIPQLMNVLIGDMSFVGPRPEVEKYVKLYNEEQRLVLSIRPGITDMASIEYMDENKLLESSENPETVYIEKIMPDKIRLNMQFIKNVSVALYFKIIFLTLIKIIR